MSGTDRTAGWSAAQKAAQVRQEGRGGPLRRLARLLGVDPSAARTEAVAGRWEAGARGEEMTAALLQPLAVEGWGGFYDRALPTGRANFDHVLVPPGAGLVVLVDSKLWSRKRGAVARTDRGGLVHGREDRSGAVRSLTYEARVLGRELAREGCAVRVAAVMAVHSAPVAGHRFMVGECTVIEATGLVGLLRSWAGTPDPAGFGRLAAAADRVLPRYEQGTVR